MARDSYSKREPGWGIVKTLTDTGFGFIAAEGQEKDVQFHSKELMGVAFDDIRVGDLVEFNIEQGVKGPFAVNVHRNGGPRRQGELQIITPDSLIPGGPTDPVSIEFFKAITDEVVHRLQRTRLICTDCIRRCLKNSW